MGIVAREGSQPRPLPVGPDATGSTGFIYSPHAGRIVFGAGVSRARTREEIDRLGFQRVLVLAADEQAELADDISRPLGSLVVGRFSAVRPHVPVSVAEAACAMARRLAVDCLLSIGGGSTIGAAKAVALETGLPIVAVPTTYAGSEMTTIYGLTSGQKKQTGHSPRVLPAVVLYDPDLTLSLPVSIAAPSALNAIAHSVEALYAPGANPVTSLIAERAIAVLSQALPRLCDQPDDRGVRGDMLYGAYLAGTALGVAGTSVHHKICHVLGGAYDLPHAETHAIVLPHVVRLQERLRPAIMERVGTAVENASAATGIWDLARRVGIPAALQDIGMEPGNVEEAVSLVAQAVSDIDEIAIRTILTNAHLGAPPQG